jgi:hypothetical protein
MTATAIAVTKITNAGVAGVAPVAGDSVNGNTVSNNGLSTWVEVTNADTAVHHISFQPTRTVAGFEVTPPLIAIPASTTVPIKFGPFSAQDYGPQLEITVDSAQIKISAYSF